MNQIFDAKMDSAIFPNIVREVAKKKFLYYCPGHKGLPLEFNCHRNQSFFFSLKVAENGFRQTNIHHNIVSKVSTKVIFFSGQAPPPS